MLSAVIARCTHYGRADARRTTGGEDETYFTESGAGGCSRRARPVRLCRNAGGRRGGRGVRRAAAGARGRGRRRRPRPGLRLGGRRLLLRGRPLCVASGSLGSPASRLPLAPVRLAPRG